MPVPEPDLTQLRGILVAERARSGWTFEQLAEYSGVSRQTLLNISSGKYNGDLRTWIKLAAAFEVRLDDLLAPTMMRAD